MEKLSEKAQALKTEYLRNWRKKNPDKLKQYERNYWEKKAKAYTIEMQAIDLHIKGYSQREIARELNISIGSVNNYLNRQ